MENIDELNADILKITQVIKTEFPELIKYLNEFNETIPDLKHPEVNIESLKKYFNSLEALLFKYAPTHPCLKCNMKNLKPKS